MLKNLGQRIRQIRKGKGLTLVEVAQKTGVAQATLSRIETGSMIGTVESHEKIAEVLGVGLSDIYTGLDKRYEEVAHLTKEVERKVTHRTKNVQVELLGNESGKHLMTPYNVTLQPSHEMLSQQSERGTEKFLYVLEGEMKAKIHNDEYLLKTGESLFFDASLPHHLLNDRPKPARLLMIVSTKH